MSTTSKLRSEVDESLQALIECRRRCSSLKAASDAARDALEESESRRTQAEEQFSSERFRLNNDISVLSDRRVILEGALQTSRALLTEKSEELKRSSELVAQLRQDLFDQRAEWERRVESLLQKHHLVSEALNSTIDELKVRNQGLEEKLGDESNSSAHMYDCTSTHNFVYFRAHNLPIEARRYDAAVGGA